MLECVINVSEGRHAAVLERLAAAGGRCLLDVHADPYHHRAVLTLAGAGADVESAARHVASAATALIDLRTHAGVHPRLGATDVVPFVALEVRGPPPGGTGHPRLADGDPAPALAARERFARWAADTLGVPCFYYGPERSLPDVRRRAWKGLAPDRGPALPHPTAGACVVGARRLLVAYNLWVDAPLERARAVAAELRAPALRTLGLAVGAGVQVSCNMVAPLELGPAAVYDAVASRLPVQRAELVGLLPAAVLDGVAPDRWEPLGLSPGATIEARLERAGLDGGRFTGAI